MFGEWHSKIEEHAQDADSWCLNHPNKPIRFATLLYGSQNYDLATPNSDVDTKTIIIPSLDMMIMDSRRVSIDHYMEDGSIDMRKDIREMFDCYLKGNINFVETLFTQWRSINPEFVNEWMELIKWRDRIANARPRKLMHMVYGMAKQKYVAFNKPFEGKKDILERYGYDPKQLYHLYRLYSFALEYSNSGDFQGALVSCSPKVNIDEYKYTMKIKTDPYPLKEAKYLREAFIEEIENIVQKADYLLPENNEYLKVKEFLYNLAARIIKKSLAQQLFLN